MCLRLFLFPIFFFTILIPIMRRTFSRQYDCITRILLFKHCTSSIFILLKLWQKYVADNCVFAYFLFPIFFFTKLISTMRYTFSRKYDYITRVLLFKDCTSFVRNDTIATWAGMFAWYKLLLM